MSPAFTARLHAEATVRLNVAGGFTLQPRAGIGAGGSLPGGGVAFASRFGLGAGATFAVHPSVALTPTVGYDVFLFGGIGTASPPLIHRFVGEFCVTLVLGEHAIAEFYAQGGVGFLSPSVIDLALGGGGVRFGITFGL